MAKMTQTQIIAEMAGKSGISKKQTKDFLTALVDLAHREAKKGEFALAGLGKLVKQKRKARLGRNPATGEVQSRFRQDCPSSEWLRPRRTLSSAPRSSFSRIGALNSGGN
jgi:DNA-binding protein HU-beta